MKKIFTSIITAIFTVLNIYATEIDGINYNLDDVTLTASVISKNPKYAGNVIIPASVTYEEQNYSVTQIDAYAFSSCYNLDSLTLPPHLKYIRGGAFESSGLRYIRIPAGVKEIEGMAFLNCAELDSVDFEEGVTTIGSYAFANCTKLRSITIPSSVTNMDAAVFQGDTSLTSVQINGAIHVLETDLFRGCTNLRSFDVPESVQSISDAFKDCVNLEYVILHEGIVNLGYDAFYGCTNLRNITLPSTTLHMYNSLWSCANIEYIRTYAVNPPDCTGYCFRNINKSIPIYVPAGSGSLYRSAEHWKSFSNIIEEGTPTGFNPISTSNKDNKIINNGQIFIQRGDNIYTITGAEVK